MKNNNKRKIIIFITISVILIVALIGLIIVLLSKNNSYVYKITIDNDVITVYNSKILLNDKNIKYKKQNVKKFIDYIERNFKTEDREITLDKDKLSEKQLFIMQSIIEKYPEAEFESDIEEYKYRVFLNDKYIIYLKDNDLIHVKQIKESADGIYITKIEKTYDINFSSENTNKVVNYILSLFAKENSSEQDEVYIINVHKDEEKYINSIIYNDESYLEEDDVTLLYTISYSGINCPTPTLYLYDDFTYEYYYTFAINDNKLKPKIGTYTTDINEIILQASDISEFVGGYVVKDVLNDVDYYIDASVEEVQNLLNETDASLSSCLVQQE